MEAFLCNKTVYPHKIWERLWVIVAGGVGGGVCFTGSEREK